jgi:hypothetical protein
MGRFRTTGSLLIRKRHAVSVASETEESNAALWLDLSRGKRAPTLFEQVYSSGIQSGQGTIRTVYGAQPVLGCETSISSTAQAIVLVS